MIRIDMLRHPPIDFRFAPESRHSEAHAGLPVVTHSGSRGSPTRDTLYRRLQPFRHLHDCSGCFRLERSPGGTCTHWKSATLPRRTPSSRRSNSRKLFMVEYPPTWVVRL